MAITITVRSYTVLPHPPSNFKLGHPFELKVEEGTTLVQLTSEVLAVPKGHVTLVAVNRQRQPPHYILQAGDSVELFPPIGGGQTISGQQRAAWTGEICR